MQIAIYVLGSVFVLFGLGILNTAFRGRRVGLYLGSLCYLGGGAVALLVPSWWPLLVGFGLSFVVRAVFGDPFRK